MASQCNKYWWCCIAILLILMFSVEFGTALIAVIVKPNSCETKNCYPDASTVKQVALLDHCSKTIDLDDAAVSIVPGVHIWTPLPWCETCRISIQAPTGHQLTSTVYNLWTETDNSGHCVKNRLDIYDGSQVDASMLLSESDGICGDTLPDQSYQSSYNTMTIRLTTQCPLFGRDTQYGSFNLVVASAPARGRTLSCPGRFECQNGRQCFAKTFVCDRVSQCTDHSDEYDCRHTFPWLTVLLVVAGVFAVAMCVSIVFLICRRCCYQPGYTMI